ncbi:hypothetical protein CEXT_543661 [Caerostris extrusa]|uniref:Uncharacterized protein n=1 Tax=Caerostris extrusa TaxID=172846 RepID=A0AAV4QZF7_CAEEX|nr:hypothetical protein CEXT_543661 [Caerostris extrusa]
MQSELRQIFSKTPVKPIVWRRNAEFRHFARTISSLSEIAGGMFDAPHFNVVNIKCNAVECGGTMLFVFMSPEEIHLGFKQIRGEFHWKRIFLRSLPLHNYCFKC